MASPECTNSDCEATATKVMAMSMAAVPCVFVGAYCDPHAETIREMGGWFAAGDADVFKPEAMEISGVRR